MTGKPPCTPSLFAQIMAAASHAAMHPEAQRPAWPRNPFSRGPHPNATTGQVLALLRSVCPQLLPRHEIMRRLGSTRGAVQWALLYLVERGDIEAIPRLDRPPYCRYRAIVMEPGDE